MKGLKDRAEMTLVCMLQMDPTDETPHTPMGCYPVYADGTEEPATGIRIYGPIECDTQPDICEVFRWPGEEKVWPAEIITDMPHVIDELLVHTSDLEVENERFRAALDTIRRYGINCSEPRARSCGELAQDALAN